MAIENSNSLEFNYNSPQEHYFYEMFEAYTTKNIMPNDFRNISSSDWSIIKKLSVVSNEKINLFNAQEQQKADMKSEMNKRMKKWWK